MGGCEKYIHTIISEHSHFFLWRHISSEFRRNKCELFCTCSTCIAWSFCPLRSLNTRIRPSSTSGNARQEIVKLKIFETEMDLATKFFHTTASFGARLFCVLAELSSRSQLSGGQNTTEKFSLVIIPDPIWWEWVTTIDTTLATCDNVLSVHLDNNTHQSKPVLATTCNKYEVSLLRKTQR